MRRDLASGAVDVGYHAACAPLFASPMSAACNPSSQHVLHSPVIKRGRQGDPAAKTTATEVNIKTTHRRNPSALRVVPSLRSVACWQLRHRLDRDQVAQ